MRDLTNKPTTHLISADLSRRLVASALAGAASGARSFTGVGALVLATPSTARRQPDATLAKPLIKTIIGLAGGQELVMDKLPKTPNRTEVLGLCTRSAGAVSSAIIVARREHKAATIEPSSEQPTDEGTNRLTDPSGAQDRQSQRRRMIITTSACILVAMAAAAASAAIGVTARNRAERAAGPTWVAAATEDLLTLGLATAAVRICA